MPLSSYPSTLRMGLVFLIIALQLFATGIQAQLIVAENPIDKISIFIEPNPSNTRMKIRVTNNNTSPVTILDHFSPFSENALRIGLFAVAVEGVEWLGFPVKKGAHTWSPKPAELINLDPGENRTHEIDFKNPLRNTCIKGRPEQRIWSQHLGKEAKVHMSGDWEGVWMKSKEDVLKGEWGRGMRRGSYTSNTVTVRLS